MTTTPEFLHARLDDLELAAHAMMRLIGSPAGDFPRLEVAFNPDRPEETVLAAEYLQKIAPAFILKDIAAKRAILDTHDNLCKNWHKWEPSGDAEKDVDSAFWFVLGQLASAFRDHPDFESIPDGQAN